MQAPSVHATSRPGTGPSVRENLELIDYLRILWDRKWLVVAGTVACALTAASLSRLNSPRYEAVVTLMVSQSKMAEQAGQPAAVANFTVFLRSQTLAADVVREFKLDKPPHELTPLSFLSNSLRVDEAAANLISARISLADPVLAADVANRLAEKAVDLNRQINQRDTIAVRDFIKTQLDEAHARLQQNEQALVAYRREAQVDVLRKDADSMLVQRGRLLPLLVDIEAEQARSARAAQELAQHQRVLTFKRSIDHEGALMEAARPATNGAGLLALEMHAEHANPIYERLAQELALGRTRLAALEREREQILDEVGATANRKFSDLYRREIEVARLEAEFDLSKRLYADVAMRYEQARIQVASRSTELQIVDRAIRPERPVSQGTVRSFAVGFGVGLIAFIFLAFLLEYISQATAMTPRRAS